MANTTDTASITSADVQATTGVLLITDNNQAPDHNDDYSFALAVAAASNVPVTLYSRSEETWGDSQHPEGPLHVGDSQLADRQQLERQIAWFNEHQVHGQGWVSTLPSISAVLTALAQVEADVVIVPGAIDRKLFERALEGGSLAETVAEQIRRNDEVAAMVVEVVSAGNAKVIAD